MTGSLQIKNDKFYIILNQKGSITKPVGFGIAVIGSAAGVE